MWYCAAISITVELLWFKGSISARASLSLRYPGQLCVYFAILFFSFIRLVNSVTQQIWCFFCISVCPLSTSLFLHNHIIPYIILYVFFTYFSLWGDYTHGYPIGPRGLPIGTHKVQWCATSWWRKIHWDPTVSLGFPTGHCLIPIKYGCNGFPMEHI